MSKSYCRMRIIVKGDEMSFVADTDQDVQDLAQMLLEVGEIFRKSKEKKNGNNQS